jgi:hypothetical protein
VVWQSFPDDDLPAKITARELFNAEETAAYAADLDAQVEEHGVLHTARAATRLWDELRDELWAEGSGVDCDSDDDEYVHLADTDLNDDFDADDLAYLELPTDEEAIEQRTLMALFEMQRRDECACCLMTTERRAAADRMAAAQQRVHHSACRRNMAVSMEARGAAE